MLAPGTAVYYPPNLVVGTICSGSGYVDSILQSDVYWQKVRPLPYLTNRLSHVYHVVFLVPSGHFHGKMYSQHLSLCWNVFLIVLGPDILSGEPELIHQTFLKFASHVQWNRQISSSLQAARYTGCINTSFCILFLQPHISLRSFPWIKRNITQRIWNNSPLWHYLNKCKGINSWIISSKWTVLHRDITRTNVRESTPR